MKILIIEDELISSRRLERMLIGYDFMIISHFQTIKSAVKWFQENEHPDLIFMDIQLADGMCFEIFDSVKIESPIVFTTAFDEYVLKAFDYNSISYLLKPIQKSALDKAIKKASAFVKTKSELKALKNIILADNLKHFKTQFAVKVGVKIKLIGTKDIHYLYSENNATHLKCDVMSYVINNSLNQLSEELNPIHFFQINRKIIINKDYIAQAKNYTNSRFKVKIKQTDEEFIVSRNRAKDFISWLDS